MQLSAVIVLLSLVLEIVEFNEAYKYIRPYKFYNPPSQRPSQWHSYSRAPKHYRSKRIPPRYKHRPYELDYRRYAPRYEDSVDTTDGDKPYVIVIQLPRRKEKQKSRSSHSVHIVKPSKYTRDITDYIDDDDDDGDGDELKVYRLDNKKVRIKVNDRLSVLAA